MHWNDRRHKGSQESNGGCGEHRLLDLGPSFTRIEANGLKTFLPKTELYFTLLSSSNPHIHTPEKGLKNTLTMGSATYHF
jgi:hypothetical protein